MAEEIVTLAVQGVRWHRWTRAAVSYSATKGMRTFAFTLTDDAPFGHRWSYMPGTECKVFAGSDEVASGFINTMSPSFDKNNHTVEIQGASKAQDAARSSAEHKTGEFKNKTALEIAKELDAQNVGFSSDVAGLKKHKLFRVDPGESVFSAVERLARKENLIFLGQPDGSILITKGGSKTVHPPLVEGVNILGGNASFSDADKNSEYKVKGQKTFGTQAGSLRIEASAKDSSVKRNLPKVIHAEAGTSKKDAKERAKKHRDQQQAKSITASFKVQGWRDANGVLWTANTLIYVYCPTLKLDMQLLIDTVSLTQDANGTVAQLGLVQPKALGSDAKAGAKADEKWKYDPQDTDDEGEEADPDE